MDENTDKKTEAILIRAVETDCRKAGRNGFGRR
jgi:hypothetical protein